MDRQHHRRAEVSLHSMDTTWDNIRYKIRESTWDKIRVRKSENFPDSKIVVAKTFRIKHVNCIIFQIRDKYA